MPKIVDLTNKVFGRLSVVSYSGIKNNARTWRCLCTCGNYTVVRRGDLQSGKTQSCGCLALETRRLPTGEAAINKARNSYVQGANRRGYSWELSREEFVNITKQNCFYCDSIPSNCRDEKSQCKNGSYTYNGIDRVDNTKGYTLANVVPCCKKCNTAKGNYSQQEFFSWAENLYIKTLINQRKINESK